MMQTTKNSFLDQFQNHKFPPELMSDLRVAAVSDQRVFFRQCEAIPGKCENCGGNGSLWFQFSKSGPLDQPATNAPSAFYNGSWYAVESRMYPCPVCGSRQSRIEYLYEESGLELDERTWKLNYIARLDGKASALKMGRNILAQLPKPAGWVVIYGPYGVGKSGVLRSIVAGCVREMVHARYVRADDILREMRATFNDQTDVTEDQVLNRYGKMQVLAIDEVDRVSDTRWSRSALFTLLDTRYKRRSSLTTLIATNCHPDQMPAGFEYLQSRMQEGERVEMSGKDFRSE